MIMTKGVARLQKGDIRRSVQDEPCTFCEPVEHDQGHTMLCVPRISSTALTSTVALPAVGP